MTRAKPHDPQSPMPPRVRLGVNIDHVATLRNARGSAYPDPVRAALVAQEAGADGITAHLREDRRHIIDSDIDRLMDALEIPLNFEMAATDEMLAIALRHRPHAVCLVPEKRAERTTEGGLDVAGDANRLAGFTARLLDAGSRVSLFIGHDPRQIEAAVHIGAPVIELHTGRYCDLVAEGHAEAAALELAELMVGAKMAHDAGLEVHAGHGISFATVQAFASMEAVRELNIGHFLISESVFMGLDGAIAEMRRLMDAARG